MSSIKYWLWLANKKGLRQRSKRELLYYFGSPENIYFAEETEYVSCVDIDQWQADLLADKNTDEAEAILNNCTAQGIHIVTIADGEYPRRLNHIYDPPCVLYVRGNLPAIDEGIPIAVVGARKASPYGVRCANNMGYKLARSGALIISGLARGCDSEALRGALRAGGTVVAVLGCGVDVVYPRENKSLYEDVAANGALISEYPPGTAALGAHFPRRNRIISGLSLGTVVVEAGIHSGALITAGDAMEQGRDVFAIPGPVDAELSRGCNHLIQEGAILVCDSEDVLCGYRMNYPNKLRPAEDAVLYEEQPTENTAAPVFDLKEIDNANKIEYIDINTNNKNLTDDQLKIVSVMAEEPLYVDDILAMTEIPIRRVLSALTVLEIENLVLQESGRRFLLNAVVKK